MNIIYEMLMILMFCMEDAIYDDLLFLTYVGRNLGTVSQQNIKNYLIERKVFAGDCV